MFCNTVKYIGRKGVLLTPGLNWPRLNSILIQRKVDKACLFLK